MSLWKTYFRYLASLGIRPLSKHPFGLRIFTIDHLCHHDSPWIQIHPLNGTLFFRRKIHSFNVKLNPISTLAGKSICFCGLVSISIQAKHIEKQKLLWLNLPVDKSKNTIFQTFFTLVSMMFSIHFHFPVPMTPWFLPNLRPFGWLQYLGSWLWFWKDGKAGWLEKRRMVGWSVGVVGWFVFFLISQGHILGEILSVETSFNDPKSRKNWK